MMSNTLFERGEHTFASKEDYDGYEGMAQYKPSRGDILIIDQEWLVPRWPWWATKVKAKLPLLGLRWTPTSTGWGCRKPTHSRPAFTLRWTPRRHRYWEPARPKRNPGEPWREWRLRIGDWKAARTRIDRVAIRPYIYCRGKGIPSPKRCGNPFPDSKELWVAPGVAFTVRTEVAWNDRSMHNGSLKVTLKQRSHEVTILWGGLQMAHPDDQYHPHRSVKAWTNYWTVTGQYFVMKRIGARVYTL